MLQVTCPRSNSNSFAELGLDLVFMNHTLVPFLVATSVLLGLVCWCVGVGIHDLFFWAPHVKAPFAWDIVSLMSCFEIMSSLGMSLLC